jgi:3-oxoadipate enol-lactonase
MPIGYMTLGSGDEHVLMLHDWSCDQTTYEPTKPFLDGAQYTYVFADLRGYGLSKELDGEYTADEAASDCIELVESLGWRRFHIVSHSMTGLVAQQIALQATDRVKSVVAACPVSAAGFPMDEATWSYFTSVTHDDDAYREMQRSLCSGVLSERWLDEKLRRNRATTSPACRLGYLTMWAKADLADRVRGLPTPFLVLTGENDVEGLRAEAMQRTFLAMHPNSTLHVIPNCGHYPMQECPPYFATVIEQFISGYSAGFRGDLELLSPTRRAEDVPLARSTNGG